MKDQYQTDVKNAGRKVNTYIGIHRGTVIDVSDMFPIRVQ